MTRTFLLEDLDCANCARKMQEAIFKDAPLRSMISFSGGKVTKAQLQGLIDKLNQQD